MTNSESYLQGYNDRFEFRGFDPDDWVAHEYEAGWEAARSHQYSPSTEGVLA